MLRVVIDGTRCQGVGMCESLRPEIFELDDAGELQIHQDAIGPEDRGDLVEAVEACPTQALSLAE